MTDTRHPIPTDENKQSGALLMEESLRRELEPALAAEKGKRRPSYGMVYGEQGQGQAAGQEQAGGGGDDDDAVR